MKPEEKIKEQLKNVGDEFTDENGLNCRMINGKKIIQIQEPTEEQKRIQQNINAYRSSGYSRPSEWLRDLY
tara:strand:- start:399 stop:611 length:213 start_codon:yes stop_codon:yes gene_type:complete